jgi:hypothetical protein
MIFETRSSLPKGNCLRKITHSLFRNYFLIMFPRRRDKLLTPGGRLLLHQLMVTQLFKNFPRCSQNTKAPQLVHRNPPIDPHPLSWTDRLIVFTKVFSGWLFRHVFQIHQRFRDRLRLHYQGSDLCPNFQNCMTVQHTNLHLVPSKHRTIPTLGRGIFWQNRQRKAGIAFHARPYSMSLSHAIVKINCEQ